MIPNIEPISTADRERAKELCAKATPGPWAWSEGYCSLDAAPMEHVLWPQNSLGEPEDAAQAVASHEYPLRARPRAAFRDMAGGRGKEPGIDNGRCSVH